MTSKQAFRAIKRHNISIVHSGGLWYAGDAENCLISANGHTLSNDLRIKYHGSQHVGQSIELAVEDFCNAHNLDWEDE